MRTETEEEVGLLSPVGDTARAFAHPAAERGIELRLGRALPWLTNHGHAEPALASALPPAPLAALQRIFSELDGDPPRSPASDPGRLRPTSSTGWNLYADLEQPGCYLETFVGQSWEEHLRQHGRLTVADLDVEQRAKSMHRGEGPPRVRHLLWAPAALDA